MIKSTIRQQNRLTEIDWFSSSICYILTTLLRTEYRKSFRCRILFPRWSARYRLLCSTYLSRDVRTCRRVRMITSTGPISGFLSSRSSTSSLLSVNYRMMMLANKLSVIQGWCHSDMCRVSFFFLDDTDDLSLTLDPCWHRTNNN